MNTKTKLLNESNGTAITYITPEVHTEAEFFEIVNDFGNPMEVLREAISNAIDWKATEIWISFSVEDFEGNKRLVIKIKDNGDGMTEDVLKSAFWGLGFSPARDKKEMIGEKGHGTKIYLRSERVIVKTQTNKGAYESICDKPLSYLSKRQLHKPTMKKIDKFIESGSGTEITIIGYNDNERSKFVQDNVKDYIQWFTKAGSIELQFGIKKYENFIIHLKSLDREKFEDIKYGHIFPKENSDIEKLFQERDTSAADYYVKKYIWNNTRLSSHPEVTFDTVIYVEGEEVKKGYNPMIRERKRTDTGRYRIGDRYGLWLCKDYIPITRINDWITGFGTGSNSIIMLHGFINCQNLKLTANRGTIANTDPKILEELQSKVKELVNEIDVELHKKGIYTLKGWQEERRTIEQERAEFERRIKSLKNKKTCKYKNCLLFEPQNESELFGLFIIIYTLHPEIFEFEPLDYNTFQGIDIIGRNKSDKHITEGQHWYIELKYHLKPTFNHTFGHIRWIICWEFDKKIEEGCEFVGTEESDNRKIVFEKDENKNVYFLDNPKKKSPKIQVLRFKEFIKDHLSITF